MIKLKSIAYLGCLGYRYGSGHKFSLLRLPLRSLQQLSFLSLLEGVLGAFPLGSIAAKGTIDSIGSNLFGID